MATINGGRGLVVNRPQPKMKSQAYKTYSIRQPIATHFRAASCAEVNCDAYLNGWTLRIDTLSEQLQFTARHSGRSFKELDLGAEGGVCLVFDAGQPCFATTTHQLPLERPAFFIVGRGDFRTFSPRKAYQHSTPENWAEDMAEHLDRIHAEIAKG